MDEERSLRVVKGIPKKVSIGQIPASRLRRFYNKGFQLYAIHILDSLEEKGPEIEHMILVVSRVQICVSIWSDKSSTKKGH